MIVKLTKTTATARDTEGRILYFDENRFSIWPNRREKIKFLKTKDIPLKSLNFLDMLNLSTWEYGDVLIWDKKQ